MSSRGVVDILQALVLPIPIDFYHHSNYLYLGRLRLKPDPLVSLLGKIGFGVTGGGSHRSASFGGVDGDCADAPEIFADAVGDLVFPPDGLAERLESLQARP